MNLTSEEIFYKVFDSFFKFLIFLFHQAAEGDDKTADVTSDNPWLKNISEYLVDESSAEEEELVGEKEEKKEEEPEETPYVKITRDSNLVKVSIVF